MIAAANGYSTKPILFHVLQAETEDIIKTLPIGMKKQFPTFIHETAAGFDKVFVSAGKVGFQIELAPEDLISVSECKIADIVV